VKRALRKRVRCAVVLILAGALCLGAASAVSVASAAGASTAPNPTVIFATPGSKQVTLTPCNGAACSSITQAVQVLDPVPAVISASASGLTAEVGQLVELVGTGRGKPPLTYTWQVIPSAAPAVNLPGATAWWDTTGYSPGAYQVKMTVANSFGTAISAISTVTLLPAQGSNFYTVTPCRAYDSRSATALTSGLVRTISVTACGIPADARAVAGNLTVISPSGPGALVLFPGNYPVSGTSTVNFATNAVRANSVVMTLASDGTGTLNLYASLSNNGNLQVLFDVSGYFK
jgi:PKD repeat protein